MNRVVVDASVAIKWSIPEIHSTEALRYLDPSINRHAPELLLVEIDNILLKKTNRGEITSDESLRIAGEIRESDTTIHPMGDLMVSALSIALATGRSAYDSMYLALGVCPSIAFDPWSSNNAAACCQPDPAGFEGGMTKTYRDWSSDQAYLFPPSPNDWLPDGDLVYFLLDTVATLDLSPIFSHYERELRGQPPFHPRMMVALLLYCYATATRSSRKIMRRCHVDVACRVIVGEDIPDFRTISDFRKIHLARLEALFVEVLKLCALAGLAKVGTIALDGTKVKANASRHKAMSYDRMKSEEVRLKEEIAKLLAEAKAVDEAEDIEHGPDRHGDELPDELARRQGRLAKIQGARKLLEERARAEAAEEVARRDAEGKSPPATPPSEAVPAPKDQINFTDPDSRIMKASNKGWDQCGNAQAVTNEHQIILAADVTQQANDVRQAVPMVDQTRANLDAAGVKGAIKAALGDAGYYSEANAKDLEQRGIDPYLATERLKHHEKVASAPRGRIPKDLSAKQRMARKLRTKKGREMYAKRKGMIEPIFGQLKQVLGFRQFSMRGLASMRGEWRLMATVHNLLKLWRHDQRVEMAG